MAGITPMTLLDGFACFDAVKYDATFNIIVQWRIYRAPIVSKSDIVSHVITAYMMQKLNC